MPGDFWTLPDGSESAFSQQNGQMLSKLRFMKLCLFATLILEDPARRALRRQDQPQSLAYGFHSQVPDVAAGKAAASDKSILRRTGPACFDGQLPDSKTKRQKTSDHGGVVYPKAMRILFRDLNAGTLAIGLGRKSLQRCCEPLNAGLAQQVVGAAQRQICVYISAT